MNLPARGLIRAKKIMFFGDYHYLLFVFVPGLLIGLWAQMKLMSAFGKYSHVPVESGLTGAAAAEPGEIRRRKQFCAARVRGH